MWNGSYIRQQDNNIDTAVHSSTEIYCGAQIIEEIQYCILPIFSLFGIAKGCFVCKLVSYNNI